MAGRVTARVTARVAIGVAARVTASVTAKLLLGPWWWWGAGAWGVARFAVGVECTSGGVVLRLSAMSVAGVGEVRFELTSELTWVVTADGWCACVWRARVRGLYHYTYLVVG